MSELRRKCPGDLFKGRVALRELGVLQSDSGSGHTPNLKGAQGLNALSRDIWPVHARAGLELLNS